jgi:hypothetical protein
MANKKLIAGGIIVALAASITVVALIPVMIYGSGETFTEVQLGMSTDGTSQTSSLSTSTIQTSQSDTWDPTQGDPQVRERALNAYEMFFRELAGEDKARLANQANQAWSWGSVNLSIYITFNLTTPSNESHVFVFSFEKLDAQSLDIVFTLESEDFQGETGEFFLEITVSISLDVDLPDPNPDIHYDHDFAPVNTSFTV